MSSARHAAGRSQCQPRPGTRPSQNNALSRLSSQYFCRVGDRAWNVTGKCRWTVYSTRLEVGVNNFFLQHRTFSRLNCVYFPSYIGRDTRTIIQLPAPPDNCVALQCRTSAPLLTAPTRLLCLSKHSSKLMRTCLIALFSKIRKMFR